jgi:hypothetical protein
MLTLARVFEIMYNKRRVKINFICEIDSAANYLKFLKIVGC